jgi:hypothetical protein
MLIRQLTTSPKMPFCFQLCLDCCYYWPDAEPYPLISTAAWNGAATGTAGDSEEDIKESELKDFQYVKNDLIGFLVERTNLLTRFKYLILNLETALNEAGVLGILKVLIRTARHSPNKLIECDELLRGIAKNFMTSNWTMIGKNLISK